MFHVRRSSDDKPANGAARAPGPRARRDRDTRDASAPTPERRDRAPGNRSSASPERQDRVARDRGGRGERGRGPPGSRDRQRSGGRDEPRRRPEVKLYALESVVDRGFEDVEDTADDSGARRVHWTIVKRSVADQKSGKSMSASYVLRRDGVDAEFPNLGAARAAAHKTIVHPEKLTMSKAEHVAAKKQ